MLVQPTKSNNKNSNMNLQLTGSNMKELSEELLTFPTLVKMSLNV